MINIVYGWEIAIFLKYFPYYIHEPYEKWCIEWEYGTDNYIFVFQKPTLTVWNFLKNFAYP